jgi:TolB protein
MAVGGNTDIWRYDIATRQITRLTSRPGIDTSPSYSPDGSEDRVRKRSRRQPAALCDECRWLGNQRRISFGEGRSASPVWSPRGDLYRLHPHRRRPFRHRRHAPRWQRASGCSPTAIRMKAPTWSPNGRVIMFARGPIAAAAPPVVGRYFRPERTAAATPLDASDPAWSPLLP